MWVLWAVGRQHRSSVETCHVCFFCFFVIFEEVAPIHFSCIRLGRKAAYLTHLSINIVACEFSFLWEMLLLKSRPPTALWESGQGFHHLYEPILLEQLSSNFQEWIGLFNISFLNPEEFICSYNRLDSLFRFYRKTLEPGFRDFLSFSHKSISELWLWCWVIRPAGINGL